MRPYLRPFSFLYDTIVGVKNSLYDRKYFSSFKSKVPVVSIGNLTMGGTGKTPVTDYCLKALVADGKKVAVISRSYRADAGSPCPVDVSHPFAARYYGDEPVLLATQNPQVTVFVGPSKWQTARYAQDYGQYDLFIVDDGFQHRKLDRNLNIVILDATEALANYRVLPEGRAREPWNSLSRADVIVISKCNLAESGSLKELEAMIPAQKEILHFGYDIHEILNVQTGERRPKTHFLGRTIFLVSAIARPDLFEKMMGDVADISEQSLHFSDHHQYSAADVEKILKAFKESGADYLVTTQKDAVKLKVLLAQPEILWSASLEVVEQGRRGRLHEIITQTVF